MTSVEDDTVAPNFRFKRRKTTHTKRARTEAHVATAPSNVSLGASAPHDAPEAVQDEEESVVNLREIIRSRKRHKDRLKDVSRKPEPQTELAQVEALSSDQYAGRFAAQTGQAVDTSDKQM